MFDCEQSQRFVVLVGSPVRVVFFPVRLVFFAVRVVFFPAHVVSFPVRVVFFPGHDKLSAAHPISPARGPEGLPLGLANYEFPIPSEEFYGYAEIPEGKRHRGSGSRHQFRHIAAPSPFAKHRRPFIRRGWVRRRACD